MYTTAQEYLEKWQSQTDFKEKQKEARKTEDAVLKARSIIADGLARYRKEKTRSRSKKAAVEDPWAPLAGYASQREIEDEYGWELITEARYEYLMDLWELREQSQKRRAAPGYHDLVTDILEAAMNMAGHDEYEKVLEFQAYCSTMAAEAKKQGQESLQHYQQSLFNQD